MLTDTKLKHLKAREKNYKIADRDGLYVLVTPAGFGDIPVRLPNQ